MEQVENKQQNDKLKANRIKSHIKYKQSKNQKTFGNDGQVDHLNCSYALSCYTP